MYSYTVILKDKYSNKYIFTLKWHKTIKQHNLYGNITEVGLTMITWRKKKANI